jgi:hypothetical protein
MTMNEEELPQEKNDADLSSQQKDTLNDIENLRGASNGKNEVSRLTGYDLVYGGTLLSGHDIWSLKDINKEPDAWMIAPLKSGEIDSKAPDNQLTPEQLEYIMEVEERSGLEFNDYDEAVAWEEHEYEKDDPAEDLER